MALANPLDFSWQASRRAKRRRKGGSASPATCKNLWVFPVRRATEAEGERDEPSGAGASLRRINEKPRPLRQAAGAAVAAVS